MVRIGLRILSEWCETAAANSWENIVRLNDKRATPWEVKIAFSLQRSLHTVHTEEKQCNDKYGRSLHCKLLNDFGVPLPYQLASWSLTLRSTAHKKCSLHNDVYNVLLSLIKDVNLWKPLFILLILVIYLHDNASQDTGLEFLTRTSLQRNHSSKRSRVRWNT